MTSTGNGRQREARGLALPFLELALFFRNLGGDGVLRRGCLLIEPFDKLAHGLVGIEADLERVRANEGAAKNPARKLGNVVALERVECRRGYLRAGRDLPEGDAAPLARLAELAAEIVHRSGLYMNQPTAAKPPAPARATSASRSGVMPPMAMTGSGDRRQASLRASSPASRWSGGLPAEGKTVPNIK